MSERFATAALRLSGLAGRLLAWPPGLFWASTPAELTAILAPPDDGLEPLSRTEFQTLLERDNENRSD